MNTPGRRSPSVPSPAGWRSVPDGTKATSRTSGDGYRDADHGGDEHPGNARSPSARIRSAVAFTPGWHEGVRHELHVGDRDTDRGWRRTPPEPGDHGRLPPLGSRSPRTGPRRTSPTTPHGTVTPITVATNTAGTPITVGNVPDCGGVHAGRHQGLRRESGRWNGHADHCRAEHAGHCHCRRRGPVRRGVRARPGPGRRASRSHGQARLARPVSFDASGSTGTVGRSHTYQLGLRRRHDRQHRDADHHPHLHRRATRRATQPA